MRPQIRLVTRVARGVTLAQAPSSARARDRRRGQRPGRPRSPARPDLLSARLRPRRRQRPRAHDRADVHHAARRLDRVRERAGRTVFTILLPMTTDRRRRSRAMNVADARHGTSAARRCRLGRRRRPLDPLGAGEGARARRHSAPDVLVRVRGAAGARASASRKCSSRDIRMPGESGLQLLAEVKERHPQIPIIIMTAYSDLDSAVAAFQGGAFEYLPKPFDVDHALALIRRAAIESRHSPAPRRASARVAGDPRPGAGDAGSVSRDRPPGAVDRRRC